MTKQFLDFKIVKAVDGEITIVASDETLDRMGEVIPVDSWDLKNYKKNPVLLVDHDYKVSNIVGRATKIKTSDNQLTFTPEFHGLTQLAKEVEAMVQSDFAPAVSVGFMPHQPAKDGDTIHNELLEISFVAVGANPNALSLAMKSIDDNQVKAVEQWVEDKKDVDIKPVVNEEQKTVLMTAELFESMEKQLTEYAELKEGRVLSGKTRTLISECSNALKQAVTLLDELLAATDSSSGKGADEHKSREPKVEHETEAPVKATPSVVRALQDINRGSNTLLREFKKSPLS